MKKIAIILIISLLVSITFVGCSKKSTNMIGEGIVNGNGSTIYDSDEIGPLAAGILAKQLLEGLKGNAGHTTTLFLLSNVYSTFMLTARTQVFVDPTIYKY